MSRSVELFVVIQKIYLIGNLCFLAFGNALKIRSKLR